MTRFSAEADRVLRNAGWAPGRQVRIDNWVSLLAAEGFRVHPAAEQFLTEFGGLIVNVSGPGVDHAVEPFSLHPVSVADEQDRISEWGEDLGKNLYPIGVCGQYSSFLVIDESGVVYDVIDRVGVLGPADAALEKLIVGISAEWLE